MLLLQAATDPTAVLGAAATWPCLTTGPISILSSSFEHCQPTSSRPSSSASPSSSSPCRVPAEGRGVGQLPPAMSQRLERLLRHTSRPWSPAMSQRPTVQSEIDRFRHDHGCSVLVATPHTLSEGVSLHHTTTHQIHLDRTFNAGMLLQSIDRTHRLGLPPDADCTVTYLIAARRDGSDTIDDVAAIGLTPRCLIWPESSTTASSPPSRFQHPTMCCQTPTCCSAPARAVTLPRYLSTYGWPSNGPGRRIVLLLPWKHD